MKRKMKICLFGLILSMLGTTQQNTIYAQDYGMLLLGARTYLIDEDNNSYNINETGLSAGFIIPIKCNKCKIYYKVQASLHHAEPDFVCYQSCSNRIDKYLCSINELLIGGQIPLSSRISIIPQMGIGVMGEAIYKELFDGYGSGDLYYDVSVIIEYKISSIGIGCLINYENSLEDFRGNILADRRLNISAFISR